MRKVITFLGKVARETHYSHEGAIYSGHVFAQALRQFVTYDQMLVFTTPEARQTTYPILSALADSRIEAVDIEDGRTPAEMWRMFNQLTDRVADGDTLIFDITHGFRSIPFFVFLAVAFLKSVHREVIIEAVYYGGLELGDPAPVLDLKEFITLLDWTRASEQFVQFGDAQALVSQLKKMAERAAQSDSQNEAILQAGIQSLDKTSRALRLLIADQAMTASHDLQAALQAAAAVFAQQAGPFAALAALVADTYQPLALPTPRAGDSIWASLAIERNIIHWYHERHLLVQAIGLAHEWMISWGIAQGRYPSLYKDEYRQAVRRAFNHINQGKWEPEQTLCYRGIRFSDFPDYQFALHLYGQIQRCRNDLLHAGKKEQPLADAARFEAKITRLCKKLNRLPLQPG